MPTTRRVVRKPLVLTLNSMVEMPKIAEGLGPQHVEDLCDRHTHQVTERGFRGKQVRRTMRTFKEAPGRILFPRGSFADIAKYLRARRVPFTVDNQTIDAGARDDITVTDRAETIVLRPYQRECSDIIVGDLVGGASRELVIRAPTGSGKTEFVIDAIARLRRRALIVVPDVPLLGQWVKRIAKRFGWARTDVGEIGDGTLRLRPVTVATKDTIKHHAELLEDFDVLFGDEIQAWAADTFLALAERSRARWRVGVSADERRKDRKEFVIHETFGKVAHTVEIEDLVRDGAVSPIEVLVVRTGHRDPAIEKAAESERPQLITRLWTKILDRIEANEARSQLAVDLLVSQVRQGRATLAFADRVDLARWIAAKASMAGVPCGTFLGGAKQKADFTATLARLEAGELHAAVGTRKVYRGLDVPRLKSGVVVTPTASNRQDANQQAGRVRRPFEGETARLIYMWDERLFPKALEQLEHTFKKKNVREVTAAEIIGGGR